jgi:hypothetical protein
MIDLQVTIVAAKALQIMDPFKREVYLDGVCFKFKLKMEDVEKEMVRQQTNDTRSN